MKRIRNRQLVLFLAVLLLPSLAILELGRRLMNQSEDLEARRAEDTRQEDADEIGRLVLARLGSRLETAPAGAVLTAAIDAQGHLDPLAYLAAGALIARGHEEEAVGTRCAGREPLRRGDRALARTARETL